MGWCSGLSSIDGLGVETVSEALGIAEFTATLSGEDVYLHGCIEK
jgi:hypothetical protein